MGCGTTEGKKKPAFKKEDLGSALHYPDTWDKTAPHWSSDCLAEKEGAWTTSCLGF